MKKIPIIIITKDEPRYLSLMIKSIVKRTKYPFHIFIVDNNSRLETQFLLLSMLAKEENITIVKNKKNNWVLGFNLAISISRSNLDIDQRYFVLSDGDIVVPLIKENICWLTFLVNQLDDSVVIGKLGLSFDLSYIKNKILFNSIYENEMRFISGPKLNNVVIAPVDTTLAIYRHDLFVMNEFKMLPGHASLVRPYYYTCRAISFKCRHLGWLSYGVNDDISVLNDKVVCFTKVAAYVNPVLLPKVSYKVRLFYKIFKPLYKSFWFSIVSYFWLKYIIARFPRKINEIQFNVR
jgi:glycosyltransferase involved in cell wall biosynthesis